MKFSDGYWLDQPGTSVQRAKDVRDVVADPSTGTLTAYAATKTVRGRGDTLNQPMITVTFSSPAPGTIRVRIAHWDGALPEGPNFEIAATDGYQPEVCATDDGGRLTSGDLSVEVGRGPWNAEFRSGGRHLTSSSARSVAAVVDANGAPFVFEQLTLTPGEQIYGLGERFGVVAKNGQSVDIWNRDGGTMSEQAYKNVPFFLSSRGYGVLVENPGCVSFEIASEAVERSQFSVPGQVLQYLLIDGPTPKDALTRYTGLTGRPPRVPGWSYGLWLSTSFTTSYDEATVTSFVDEMAKRDIPLSVFHFDCFWMREFHWTDFVWDPATFPTPSACSPG